MNDAMRYNYEVFLAKCLNEDSFYRSKKKMIRDDIYPWPEVAQLASILKNYDNTIEEVFKRGNRHLALYAMEISNNLAKHQLMMKNKGKENE